MAAAAAMVAAEVPTGAMVAVVVGGIPGSHRSPGTLLKSTRKPCPCVPSQSTRRNRWLREEAEVVGVVEAARRGESG